MAKDRNSTDPPLFSPDADLQEWRRKIVRWVDLIKTAAEKGTDRTYKTIWATLGRWLYDRGLPSAQQSIVDESQAKGVINYKQDDQIAAVRNIVELITVDPPIAMVSRLISSFNRVSSCRRKKTEDLSVFVSRFRGLAAEHLMHSNASSSSQVGEVLAIILLNNANLEEGTLTNAKLQLISLVESRVKEKMEQKTKEIPKVLITSLVQAYNAIAQSIPSVHKDPNLTWKRTFLAFRGDILSLTNRLHETITEINSSSLQVGSHDSVTSLVLTEQKRCKLHLEDAVSVLGNLTLTTGSTSTMDMKEVENLINRNVQKALMSVQKQGDSLSKGSKPSKTSSKSPRRQSDKTPSRNASNKRRKSDLKDDEDEDVCFDCAKPGHRRGDKECPNPSFLTKRIQAKRARLVDEKDQAQSGSFLGRGSTSGQGNQA